MDLGERETAAAVQDLEVRQMELEAQRRRLEQVTLYLTFNLLSSLPDSSLHLFLPLFLSLKPGTIFFNLNT